MKTLFSPLLTLALALASPSAAADPKTAFEARCETEMLPKLEVTMLPLNYEINNSVSSRILFYRSEHVHSGEMMLGSTSLQKTSEVSFGGSTLTDAGANRECIAPSVSVTLTFRPVNVYIAREFRPNTCAYNTVLKHEMRHVKLYEDEVPKMTDKVREQLRLRYGQRPLYAKAGETLAQLQQDVDEWLRPLIRSELERIEKKQVEVDTFEEKMQMSQACLGQLAENLNLNPSTTYRGW
jgi:hypothetical protein